MARISHQEFRSELDRLSSDPSAVPHSVQDGGLVAPTDRIPSAADPSTRRAARPRQGTPNIIGILGAAVDAVCIPYSLAPRSTSEALTALNPSTPFLPNWRDSTNQTLQRLCDDASPSYVPPTPSTPFTGGQCDGVLYRYDSSLQGYDGNCNPRTPSTSSDTIWGPVLGTRTVFEQVGSDPKRRTVLEAYGRGKGNSPLSGFEWSSVGGTSRGGSACPEATVLSFTLTPDDGSPDVCGDPEPEYDSPIPIDFDPVLDIDIGAGVPISISPSFTTNVDGGININLPGIGDVDIDIGGIDINFPGSSSDPGTDPPSDPDPNPRPEPGGTGTDPADPVPDPPTGEDPAVEEPEEPGERVIRAVLVTVSAIAQDTGILYQEENPDILIPNAGYVNFRCRASDGSSGWTDDHPVKNRRHFVECPWDGGAFDVRGTPRPGVQWNLTPIYDEIPSP